ncbi:MAG TPA: hypothetical protein VFS20_26390 [Longimicrobium sp.]|nr:hypothetical protein [Longimicrobium sp.]
MDLALREVFAFPLLSSMAEHLLDAQLAWFDPEELARLARAMSEYSEG